jgi:TRAP-type C4-dicarboxylate transport system substrate-binding protein
MRRRTIGMSALAVLAVALALVVTGCGGSEGDKAGGSEDGKPTILTLRTFDRDDPIEFAAAVDKFSGGSLRISVDGSLQPELNYEKRITRDVERGTFDLGVVGARHWDKRGVTTFRALVAPFLVDSLALEQRVLESALADRMLKGTAQLGLVGIALVPGDVRHPLAVSKTLESPSDFAGATIGIPPGGVAEATFHALGAKTRNYVPGFLRGLDGAELDLWSIAFNGYDLQASALTTNVTLWPRVQTIVMNRKAFDALTREQRDVLLRAGREAVVPAVGGIEHRRKEALSLVCERQVLSFVTASGADLTAMRAAVRPVYEMLERDPETSELISEIRKLRSDNAEDESMPLRCPETRDRGATNNASRLEGRWQTTWTVAELLQAGLPNKDAKALQGPKSVVFAGGRFRADLGAGNIAIGTYDVEGDVVSLVFERGIAVQLRRVYQLKWSVYRDSITYSTVPGSEPLLALLIKPWKRAR